MVRNVLGPGEIAALLDALGPVSGAGRRGLLDLAPVATLASSKRLRDLVAPHLPDRPGPRPARAILFDKSPMANWPVAWHQDLTLALRERVETIGFGPWSAKGSVPHVQPPAGCLERMLTVRLHLDPCPEENGALRVLPGTHRHGRLNPAQISEFRAAGPEVTCAVNAGDALLMRPLLLHASARARISGHRRVLHLEYAGFSLPSALAWHEGD